MSGRKGLGVKADDLIDKLIEKALDEVDSRHAGRRRRQNARGVATQIAIGALRYFLLKFTRNTVIAFDLQEALSFEGETGPYVQYAAVRARNILRKLAERGETLPDFAAELTPTRWRRQLAVEDFWQLLLAASKADSAIERAVASRRAGARGPVRVPAGAGVQHLLSRVPRPRTKQNREKKVVPAVDDGLLPPAAGAHARRPRNPGARVHVAEILPTRA